MFVTRASHKSHYHREKKIVSRKSVTQTQSDPKTPTPKNSKHYTTSLSAHRFLSVHTSTTSFPHPLEDTLLPSYFLVDDYRLSRVVRRDCFIV
jgi:hypothetical protein